MLTHVQEADKLQSSRATAPPGLYLTRLGPAERRLVHCLVLVWWPLADASHLYTSGMNSAHCSVQYVSKISYKQGCVTSEIR